MENENMKKMKRDLLILSYLRQNSRMKLTNMSKASRIPVSTLFDRIVDLESRGIIKKLTSLVKFEGFG
jgi:DNA-binding Lrp family transcriptional regulator